MSKKHKKICASLNFIEHFLILASLISGCVSISVFASLLGCHMRITCSVIGLNICAITAGIKKYKSIIKKKKKKHGKVALIATTKLTSIENVISTALIQSYISHDEYVLVNNVLKELMI